MTTFLAEPDIFHSHFALAVADPIAGPIAALPESGGMDPTLWISVCMLAATVLAAILAWLGANRSTKEASRSADAANVSNAIQTKMLTLQEAETERVNRERRKAFLTAQNAKVQIASSRHNPEIETYIQISNSGFATAQNISMMIDDKPAADITGLHIGNAFNRVVVGPNSAIRLQYYCGLGSTDLDLPSVVRLEWDDDSGERGSWTGSVL